jgi:hypothetical protein
LTPWPPSTSSRVTSIFVWDVVIHTSALEPVVKDATYKNKNYLSGESVEWLLVKDFEPIFQCSESPLDGHPEARVSKIEQPICGLFLGENLFR